MKHSLTPALLAAAVALAGASAAVAAEPPPDAAPQSGQPVKDAYLKGRIVSAFAVNPHVSAFDLDVKVDNGIAFLSGTVDDKTQRDLAIEIARGIDDVRDVRAAIALKPGARAERDDARRTVGQTVDDTAITATVKGRLLANESTPGARIDVTTRKGVVTLTGTVDSDAQKDLAGRIAENSKNVVAVHNELTVARR